MPAKSWDLYHEGAIPTHATFAHAELADVSVVANRLVGGLSDGVDVVSVRNGKLEISIIPTRGMGIGDMSYDGQRIGWQSPVPGPVHPALVNLSDPSGLGWLDGFDELLVRCGLESNGAPEFDEAGTLKYPLHGRIANRPAQQVKISIDPEREQVAVTGIVDETRFHFTKLRLTSTLTTRVGDKGFSIIDRVENLSESSSECQLLYHINIGLPFLESGPELSLPSKSLCRAIQSPREGQTPGMWSRVRLLVLKRKLTIYNSLLITCRRRNCCCRIVPLRREYASNTISLSCPASRFGKTAPLLPTAMLSVWNQPPTFPIVADSNVRTAELSNWAHVRRWRSLFALTIWLLPTR